MKQHQAYLPDLLEGQKQIAYECDMSLPSLDRAIRAGNPQKIPYFVESGRYFAKRADVEAWRELQQTYRCTNVANLPRFQATGDRVCISLRYEAQDAAALDTLADPEKQAQARAVHLRIMERVQDYQERFENTEQVWARRAAKGGEA